ncbi:hypothetical protein QBC47DRAFT_414068 [Echria macrotheca]|uniref:Uncharacterized protein n=1 Tax=Echria macrotheca TaxID=438768 RepID=A0AAJ0BE86_9PEZI|nr:hypothetical protein QBC47DRAFT_414068 [Echria macrotheca]
MHCPILTFVATAILIFPTIHAGESPVRPNIKRQFMSCAETYGESWIPCGDVASTFCYNPLLGQSCCETDNGYCDPGTHCAPVPGHCCLDGEDLATCARNAGFQLPAGIDLTDPAKLGPGLHVSGVGLNSSALNATLGSNGTSPDFRGQNSPYVQVSVASRRHVAWIAAGVGFVRVFFF